MMPVSWSITAAAASSEAERRGRSRCRARVRRIASTVQATTWPTAVAATIQMTMPISAGSSERRSTPYDVTPSRIQAWSSQAMLSGASSRAPRWSVVGLTG